MSGAKRTITPSCSVMSHHFSAGISGTFHDLINAQKEWNFTQQRIVNHYVACTGMTPDKVKDLMLSKTDAYLTPTEALELGLADEVRGFGESPT
jgi:ATP-dependent protease ClpP protease subunit